MSLADLWAQTPQLPQQSGSVCLQFLTRNLNPFMIISCSLFKCQVLCAPFLEEPWKWALAGPGWLGEDFSVTFLSGGGAGLWDLSGYLAFVNSLMYLSQVWQPRILWAEQCAAEPSFGGSLRHRCWPDLTRCEALSLQPACSRVLWWLAYLWHRGLMTFSLFY